MPLKRTQFAHIGRQSRKDEALAAKDEEINTLKDQLEALSKNKDEAVASETDGF